MRQEELIFVLQRLLSLRLREGTLWASSTADPSAALLSPTSIAIDASLPLPATIRSLSLRSPTAHLYEMYPQFLDLLTLSTHSSSITSAYIPSRRVSTTVETITYKGLPDGFVTGRIGSRTGSEKEGDVIQLVLQSLRLLGAEIGV